MGRVEGRHSKEVDSVYLLWQCRWTLSTFMLEGEKMNAIARLVMVLITIVASGCASLDPVGSPDNDYQETAGVAVDEINWPAQYEPEGATFYVTNQIDIAASPQTIWDVLIEAESWPEWYEGAFNVELPRDATLLSDGIEFSWKTMGQNFTSEVIEFEPPYRLGWESRKSTIKGYHAWLITPIEGGSRLITDESQFGFLAVMQRMFMPNKLRNLHDVWLAEIKERAEAREAKISQAR